MAPQGGVDAVVNAAYYIGEMAPQGGVDAVVNAAYYIGEMAPQGGVDAVVNAAYYIGEMAEWSNAAVSKTVVLLPRDRGFEPPSLRKITSGSPPALLKCMKPLFRISLP